MDTHLVSPAQQVLRNLAIVWSDFARRLQRVPIIARLESGQWRLDDYHLMLRDHRAQVMEGSRWIAQAAASIDGNYPALRSTFIRHAAAEHRDFEMLGRDYAASGGATRDLEETRRNIGSEALSAWMFHRASQPNPFDLLGAMFIIEGLGREFARHFAETIRESLGLTAEQVSFYFYHAAHDAEHLDELQSALEMGILEIDGMADAIIRTARVTARLYLLQLEEMGNY